MSHKVPQAAMHLWQDMRVAGSPDSDTSTQWLIAQNDIYDEEGMLLNFGAVVAHELRALIYHKLHYTCSGGIAHNKLLAKIASSMHKPNIQTIVPPCFLPRLLSNLPLNKLRGLGGKLGQILTDELGLKMASDISSAGKALEARFGQQQAEYLLQLSRGESNEEVASRLAPSNITCAKQFNGSTALLLETSIRRGDIEIWLQRLCEELLERIGINGAKWLSAAINLTSKNSNNEEAEKVRLSKRSEFPAVDASEFAAAVETLSRLAIQLVKESLANPSSSSRSKHTHFVSDTSLLAEFSSKQATLLPSSSHPASVTQWWISNISVQAQGVGRENDEDCAADTPDIRNFFTGGGNIDNKNTSDIGQKVSKSMGSNELVANKEMAEGDDKIDVPEGVDASVFLSLPPDIQQEIRIDARNRRISAITNNTQLQRKKPRGIQSYFSARNS